MRFAKVVFTIAGIWGIVVLTPLFWLVDVTGRRYDPPSAHPHFFYGFVAVALAWQIVFLVIGSNPIRFRMLMIPAMIEKFAYVAILAVLSGQGRIAAVDALASVPDGLIGVLFIVAFLKTRGPAAPARHRLRDAAVHARLCRRTRRWLDGALPRATHRESSLPSRIHAHRRPQPPLDSGAREEMPCGGHH